MKFSFLLISLLLILGCSQTPNDTPIDVLRDVKFNVDMNTYIDDGFFDTDTDTLRLKGEFNNWGDNLIMVDMGANGIYTIELTELIFGKTYEYRYCINDSLESLDGHNREYQVQNSGNAVTNYYNELDPTLIIFQVDMNDAPFDPTVDFVDVPGTYNDWSEGELMTDEDGDGIYELTISNIEIGFELEYKFRINYNWDTAELSGQDNRTHTVEQGENLLSHTYDVP